MGIMKLTVRATEDVATATTATAGAAAGATIGAAVGAVGGALRGAGTGIAAGARSQPAAVVGLAAVGAAGLVEWPLVVAVGGTALALRQLRRAEVPMLRRSRNQQSVPRPLPDRPMAGVDRASARAARAPDAHASREP
jgi:hypothetical protein